MYNMMQKFNLISQDLLVLLKFQKSCNLIGWDQRFATPRLPSPIQKSLPYLFLEIIGFQNSCSLIAQELIMGHNSKWRMGNQELHLFLRLVLRNSKDKNISENLGSPILGPFFSKY